MNQRYPAGLRRLGIAAVPLILSSRVVLAQPAAAGSPDRRTVAVNGLEREYFVHLPPKFDRAKPHWLLVVMGAVNGQNYPLAARMSGVVAETGFEAIVISASSPDADLNAIRFPSLGEGQFLDAIVKAMRADYRLKPRILLTGYSRGGQFAHRFALAHPEVVEAVAPLASGTWTTPDGRFLVEEIGEVPTPHTFLATTENAARVPERLRNLFEPRVAAVAGAKAAPGSQRMPFLVMCGTLDPRLPIAKAFVHRLELLGYRVDVEWPRTPHACGAPCPPEQQAEFQKYARHVVEFFRRVSGGK